jgi:transposase
VPQGRRKLELHLGTLLAAEQASLSPRTRLLIEDQRAEWRELDRRIEAFDEEFARAARTDETARLLLTIPGIGPLNATALVAAIGKAETFGRGRDLAAWLGLVPRQMTTGGKPKLLGISKRGNGYLRRMLIHGARAALPTLSKTYETCARMRQEVRMALWSGVLDARGSRMRADLVLGRSGARAAGRLVPYQAVTACSRVSVRRRL